MALARPFAVFFAPFVTIVGCASTALPGGPTAPASQQAVVVPSFVPDDATVILRFDGRAIRDTDIAPELSRMIAVSGTWSTLSAGADADPIADVDVMLCASRATIHERGIFAASWYFVLRHTRTHEEVRARIARIGEVQGVPVTWAEHDGIPYANLPVSRGGFAPHVVLSSAPGELVVAPASDVSRVLEIAVMQARARRGDEAVDPWLRTEPDELVFFRADLAGVRFPEAWTVSPPRTLTLRARVDDAQIGVRAAFTFATLTDAEAGRAHGDTLLRRWTDDVMVNLTPVGPVLRRTLLTSEGADVVANSRLTTDGARRIAQFLTSLQEAATEGQSSPTAP